MKVKVKIKVKVKAKVKVRRALAIQVKVIYASFSNFAPLELSGKLTFHPICLHNLQEIWIICIFSHQLLICKICTSKDKIKSLRCFFVFIPNLSGKRSGLGLVAIVSKPPSPQLTRGFTIDIQILIVYYISMILRSCGNCLKSPLAIFNQKIYYWYEI